MNEAASRLLTIAVVGEPETGKTCWLSRLLRRSFVPEYVPSSAPEATNVSLLITKAEPHCADTLPEVHAPPRRVIFQCWDVPGRRDLCPLPDATVRRADAVIIMFDVTNRETFKRLAQWRADVAVWTVRDDVPILVVGNCPDVHGSAAVPPPSRVVPRAMIQSWLEKQQAAAAGRNGGGDIDYHELDVAAASNRTSIDEHEALAVPLLLLARKLYDEPKLRLVAVMRDDGDEGASRAADCIEVTAARASPSSLKLAGSAHFRNGEYLLAKRAFLRCAALVLCEPREEADLLRRIAACDVRIGNHESALANAFLAIEKDPLPLESCHLLLDAATRLSYFDVRVIKAARHVISNGGAIAGRVDGSDENISHKRQDTEEMDAAKAALAAFIELRKTAHLGDAADTSPSSHRRHRGPPPVASGQADNTSRKPPDKASAVSSDSTWKEAGNTHYGKGEYLQAIDCYSAALKVIICTNVTDTRSQAVLYSNRAACRSKLRQHDMAFADCTHGIAVDKHFLRNYERLVDAATELGRLTVDVINMARAGIAVARAVGGDLRKVELEAFGTKLDEFERRRGEAIREKNNGNDCFQRSAYGRAVHHFTLSLTYLKGNDAVVLGNRCQCHLLLHDYEAAFDDASRAVTCNATIFDSAAPAAKQQHVLVKNQVRLLEAAAALGNFHVNVIKQVRQRSLAAAVPSSATPQQREPRSTDESEKVRWSSTSADDASAFLLRSNLEKFQSCRKHFLALEKKMSARLFGEAITIATAILECYPNCLPAAHARIECLARLDPDAALAETAAGLDQSPDNSLTRRRSYTYFRALATYCKGQDMRVLVQTCDMLREVSSLPKEEDGGALRPTSKHDAAAVKLLSLATALERCRFDGNLAMDAQRWDDARTAYSTAITLLKSNGGEEPQPVLLGLFLSNRCQTLLELRLYSAAFEDVSSAFTAGSTSAKLWTRHSFIMEKLEDWAAAEKSLSHAAKIDPQYSAEIAELQVRRPRVPEGPKDWYAILGVASTCTKEDIKTAVRQECLRWHPDKWADIGEIKRLAAAKVRQVTDARDELLDDDRRRKFDRQREAARDMRRGSRRSFK